jgi:Na+/glutamate symporter
MIIIMVTTTVVATVSSDVVAIEPVPSSVRSMIGEPSVELNTTATPTTATVSADVVHEDDAVTALSMNVILILCLLAAYYVKHFRYYHLPESSVSLMVGVIVGGIVRLSTDNLQLWEFVSVNSWFLFIRIVEMDRRAPNINTNIAVSRSSLFAN